MSKRKYTKRNPRRSARLSKKRKLLLEMPYEMWLYIADFLPVTFLRNMLKQPKSWSTKHLLFTAFRETLSHRLKHVSRFVNFEKLSLFPGIINSGKVDETNDLIKHFPKTYAILFQLLCYREQMANLKSTGPQRLQGIETIGKAFCRTWIQVILEENSTFSFAFNSSLSGAKVPQDSENFWNQTYLFSFQISNLFLRYHYDFHLRVSQMDPKKNTQLHCCFPGKWECTPSCENRRWPTWGLMELRGRLDFLMKHGLAWLCQKQFTRVGIFLRDRYCSLDEDTSTFNHVYVAADSVYPPN